MDEQVALGVELLGLRSEFLGGEGRQPSLDLGILLFSSQVVPFVGILFDVIEFFSVLPVTHVAPVPVDHRIFPRMHVRQKNGPVLCLVRGGQGRGNGGAFQLLLGFGQSAHFPKGGIHIDQTDGDVANFVFGHAGPGPDEGNVGSPFPQGVLSPIAFFAEVVAVVTPKHDDGVVRVGTFLQSIEDTAEHGVGITDAGKVAMNRIVPGIEGFKFLYDAGTTGLHFPDLFGKIVQVVFFDWREFDFLRIVEIKVFLRTVVGVVGGVKTYGEEEWLVMFLLQLFDRPVDPLRIRHFLFFLIGYACPFEKHSSGDLLSPVVDAGGEGFGERSFFTP